jgi:hypothetical protein
MLSPDLESTFNAYDGLELEWNININERKL